MPLLPRFDTPALLTDVPVSSLFYHQWSNVVSNLIGKTLPGDGGGALYNAINTDVALSAEKTLTWMGFPRSTLLGTAFRDDKIAAYKEAEKDVRRSLQNEYFEWRADRTAGKITKLTFVTEMPEYYNALWSVDRAAVVNLYRTLVNPVVKEADLHTRGTYNPFNKWNTTHGIVHYIQAANSLFAATDLMQRSVKSATTFRDNYEARPGLAGQTTSADPRISFDTHMQIRKGMYLTLRNPVGLYIVGWENAGITHPDGSPAGNYWKIIRGKPGMVLRLEYQVPASLGFVVGDLKIGGRPIEYGGQLAEHITVSLATVAGKIA